tara:strand:+ start:565 stop:768 length:204 start_codon:yes stop_codon:yes gene_type:complete
MKKKNNFWKLCIVLLDIIVIMGVATLSGVGYNYLKPFWYVKSYLITSIITGYLVLSIRNKWNSLYEK